MTGNPTPEETAAVLAALLTATTAASPAPRPPQAYARWRAQRIAMITPRRD